MESELYYVRESWLYIAFAIKLTFFLQQQQMWEMKYAGISQHNKSKIAWRPPFGPPLICFQTYCYFFECCHFIFYILLLKIIQNRARKANAAAAIRRGRTNRTKRRACALCSTRNNYIHCEPVTTRTRDPMRL